MFTVLVVAAVVVVALTYLAYKRGWLSADATAKVEETVVKVDAAVDAVQAKVTKK